VREQVHLIPNSIFFSFKINIQSKFQSWFSTYLSITKYSTNLSNSNQINFSHLTFKHLSHSKLEFDSLLFSFTSTEKLEFAFVPL